MTKQCYCPVNTHVFTKWFKAPISLQAGRQMNVQKMEKLMLSGVFIIQIFLCCLHMDAIPYNWSFLFFILLITFNKFKGMKMHKVQKNYALAVQERRVALPPPLFFLSGQHLSTTSTKWPSAVCTQEKQTSSIDICNHIEENLY